MRDEHGTSLTRQVSDPSYDKYVREEWRKFEANASRGSVELSALAGKAIGRVLDVGCGAGQELLPFVEQLSAYGVGIDLNPDVGLAGRELFNRRGLRTGYAFVRGRAEQLPYRAGGFDLVVCRLALPYTNNSAALAEMARVLRPEGIIFLQIQHPTFYILELTAALKRFQVLGVIHSLRVLAAGTAYSITGRQPTNRITGREIFQTERSLRREISNLGLQIRATMPGYTKYSPSFMLVKAR